MTLKEYYSIDARITGSLKAFLGYDAEDFSIYVSHSGGWWVDSLFDNDIDSLDVCFVRRSTIEWYRGEDSGAWYRDLGTPEVYVKYPVTRQILVSMPTEIIDDLKRLLSDGAETIPPERHNRLIRWLFQNVCPEVNPMSKTIWGKVTACILAYYRFDFSVREKEVQVVDSVSGRTLALYDTLGIPRLSPSPSLLPINGRLYISDYDRVYSTFPIFLGYLQTMFLRSDPKRLLYSDGFDSFALLSDISFPVVLLPL